MTEQSDYELLQLFCDGDADAFEVLVLRHKQIAFNFIYRMVGNRDRAEDLFQDTWLKVLRGAHTYQPRAKFTTWMLQIARNVTLDFFKREKLRRHASLDAPAGGTSGDDGFSMGSVLPANEPLPDQALQTEEMKAEVQKGISRLPENQRKALTLRIYHKMPYAEIAEVLDTAEGTAKYWVHEALKALSGHLAHRGVV